MIWILLAFLAPIFHGVTNILDNYLTNKVFKSAWALTFYGVCLNTLFLPIAVLLQRPELPPLSLLPFFLVVGLINVSYLYPYFKALESSDTSIVASLFALGKIFIPLFAFFLVGETLSATQYLGFFIILLSSTALTLEKTIKIRFNQAFFYMLLVSILLSTEAVLYKFILEQVNWSTGFVACGLSTFLFVLGFLLLHPVRKEIINHALAFKKTVFLFTLEEGLAFLGNACASYALALAPVTLVKGVDASQPVFVLLYALFLHKKFPHLFKEQLHKNLMLKKGLLFFCLAIGIVLSLEVGK